MITPVDILVDTLRDLARERRARGDARIARMWCDSPTEPVSPGAAVERPEVERESFSDAWWRMADSGVVYAATLLIMIASLATAGVCIVTMSFVAIQQPWVRAAIAVALAASIVLAAIVRVNRSRR